eukprot:gnl/Spiro4/26831_TR13338_c0_g1_i1.p1 gnl/Spiro4/26831_TR13338_c0_g1~~gnl/Spiro4/26831_TR13338_c0_g1_i1.p1  ORF type:complete len:153 (+),score=19.71 gnl/Spiro4/26831_TR13338_c0_g1_i1:143-601(+)
MSGYRQQGAIPREETKFEKLCNAVYSGELPLLRDVLRSLKISTQKAAARRSNADQIRAADAKGRTLSSLPPGNSPNTLFPSTSSSSSSLNSNTTPTPSLPAGTSATTSPAFTLTNPSSGHAASDTTTISTPPPTHQQQKITHKLSCLLLLRL